MYCNNCGHQVADSASFCPNCGTRIVRPAQNTAPASAANSSTAGTQSTQMPPQPQKKKSGVGGFFRSVLICLVVYLLAKGAGYLFGSSMAGRTDARATSKPVISSIPTIEVSFTPVSLGSGTFQLEHDGSNESMTLYYRDDIVYMISETITTPLGEVTDYIKARVLEYENEEKAKYSKYAFIDYSTSLIGSTFFEYLTFKNVDKEENLAGLYELGMTDSKTELISFKESKSHLLASGWTER
ncbi:MAG: zinc-ribbon domain-containing protein [Oscillospiraceae bacterium]|nr:zinc-ribbon domain-containing protein [Oscillospiraceae bacterium]